MTTDTPETQGSHRRFGVALSELREQRNTTQEDLARAADLEPAYVAGLERGERSPSWETVERLLTALDHSLTDFAAVYDRTT